MNESYTLHTGKDTRAEVRETQQPNTEKIIEKTQERQDEVVAKQHETEIDDKDVYNLFPLKPQIFVFVGKCGSGKSVCVKSIMYNYAKKQYFRFGIAYVKTKFNHSYEFIPDKYVLDKYTEKQFANYLSKLRGLKEKKGAIPPNFVIFDDMVGSINMNTGVMASFLSTHRHYNTTIFFTSQYICAKNSSTTLMREITNFAFIFRTSFKNSLKSLYEAYGQLTNDYDEFVKLFMDITDEEYCCLMYWNKDRGSKYDSYFKFQAPNPPEYKINY